MASDDDEEEAWSKWETVSEPVSLHPFPYLYVALNPLPYIRYLTSIYLGPSLVAIHP